MPKPTAQDRHRLAILDMKRYLEGAGKTSRYTPEMEAFTTPRMRRPTVAEAIGALNKGLGGCAEDDTDYRLPIEVSRPSPQPLERAAMSDDEDDSWQPFGAVTKRVMKWFAKEKARAESIARANADQEAPEAEEDETVLLSDGDGAT